MLAVLGVADSGLLEELVDAVDAGDGSRALIALGRCVEGGRDAGSFASDLEVHARELLVVQTLGELPAELSLTEEADARLRAQAERVDRAVVVRLLELLGTALEGVRAGADPRTRLELALVKAARPEVDASTTALLARIERLERERGRLLPLPRRPVVPRPSRTCDAEPPRRLRPVRGCEARACAGRADGAARTCSCRGGACTSSHRLRHVEPEPVPEAPVASSPPPPGVLCARSGRRWSIVVRAGNGLLGALIADARPAAVDGEDLTVAFASTAAFLKKKAEHPDNRAIVTEALSQVTGRRWRLSYELLEVDDEDASEQVIPTEEEWVRRFMEEFDAEELFGDQAAAAARTARAGEQASVNSEPKEA